MSRALLAVFVLVLAAPIARGADAREEERGEVARLVAGLASGDWKVRDRATKRLEEMGTAAVPALMKARHSKDPEVRHRSELILAKIAAKAAWNDLARAKLKRRITLELSREPLAKALSEFARAARLPVTMSPHLEGVAADRKFLVSVDAHDLGAAQVLARVLRPHGLTYDVVCDSVVVEGGSRLAPLLIERELSRKVGPFEFEGTALRDAVARVRAQMAVEVVFDAKAFGADGAPDKRVNLKTPGPFSAKTVLALMLAGHELGYVYDARRIIITTRERTRSTLVTQEHDISTLAGHVHLVRGVEGAERKIMEALTACVDAVGWGGGGEGASSVKLVGRSLVVKAPPATQERVEEFLKRLARATGVPEPVEAEEEEFF